MSPRLKKFGFVVFSVLSGAMMVNLLWMQHGVERRGELSAKLGTSLRSAGLPGGRAGAGADPGDDKSRKLVILNSHDKLETARAIQRELTAHGYHPGPADGAPGLMTRAAIMAYEFDNGLRLTAKPEPDLLKMLLFGIPADRAGGDRDAGVVVEREARQVVATVQETLSNLGYRVGQIDGKVGTESERAIRDFEADQALRETGRISGRLIARLARLADGGQLALGR